MTTDDKCRWLPTVAEKDIASGQSHVMETPDGPVALFNIDGQFYAMDNLCSHEELPIFQSGADDEDILMMDSGEIICPHHGAHFCPRTGDALSPPAYEPLRTYPVRVVDGIVQIAMDK